jgi:hypothetical protein
MPGKAEVKKLVTIWLAATVLVTALAPATAASANGVRTYARSGNWENYAGTSNDGSQKLCGMSERGGTHIKYSPDTGNVWVMLFKNTWRIPNGTRVPIEVGFVKNAWSDPTTAYGETKRLSGGYTIGTVTINIRPESVADFLDNFKDADKMWFRFGGTEAPWVVDMTGSRETADNFLKCMGYMDKNRPTQPYTSERKQPTQPFGSDNFQPDRPTKQLSDI